MKWVWLSLVLGCGSGDGFADLREVSNPCVYESGVVDVHLYDPLDAYTDIDFAYFSAAEGRSSCVTTFTLGDGQGLRVNCELADPVRFCGLDGACMDDATGDLFRCKGFMEFE